MEVETVILEDGKNCIVIKELIIEGIKYVYLVNAENNKDYIIRKEINNELVGLDNETEFKKAMAYLIIKQRKNN